MSELDSAVRPWLVDRPLHGLVGPVAAEVLARWFIKVAINLNVTQPYRLLVPKEDRHQLATGISPRFAVDLFTVERQNGIFDWIQGASMGFLLPATLSRSAQERVAEMTLSTNIRVADLVARVVYVPGPLLAKNLAPADDALGIWPLHHATRRWEHLPTHDDYRQARLIHYNSPLLWA